MISFVQVLPKHFCINLLPYLCFPHVSPILFFLILYLITLAKSMPYGTPKFSVFFNPVLFLPPLALMSSPARCCYTPSFQLTEHLNFAEIFRNYSGNYCMRILSDYLCFPQRRNYFLFQTFAVFSMLYVFFWVIPRRLNFITRRFGTLSVPSS
jgi:hypothetical protein